MFDLWHIVVAAGQVLFMLAVIASFFVLVGGLFLGLMMGTSWLLEHCNEEGER